MSATTTRLLRTTSPVAGRRPRRHRGPRRHQPGERRDTGARAALGGGRSRRRRRGRPGRAARVARRLGRSRGRASCSICASGLIARSDDLARSVTAEMGKTIADATAEVGRMVEMVEAACAIPTTMQGRVLEDVSRKHRCRDDPPAGRGLRGDRPVQLPAMVPFWFLPFAIACGNTFVLKPSEQVPLTQQIASRSSTRSICPGVVNLVQRRREIVEGILDHPGIDAVSFVGSAPVARLVYERAAKSASGEALGGAKNHIVVMPDAVIDKTVDGILGSAFGAAGQRCMRDRWWSPSATPTSS